MATAVCAGPSLWVFSSKRAQCSRSSAESTSLSQLTPASFTCKQGFFTLKKKGSSPRIAHSVERLGFDGKLSSEEDVSDSAVEDPEPSLELVNTDGITFEDESDDEIDGMLRQPRSFNNDWGMFAAEEGARPAADDETDSEGDDDASRPVRRRSAGDALPFPAVNWSAADKQKVEALQAFKHRYEGKGGLFLVEAMRPKHMADTEELLVDSFAELMGGLLTYRPLLAFTVKQYVRDRYATLPHSVTLVGLYSLAAQEEEAGAGASSAAGVAGTVELSFSVAGHPDVPTPAPPPNSPYICNMAIKKEYRRRGLGRQMLKAAEELALSLGCEDMYLHVRIMDTAPLTMYREAGYQVVSTDSLLSVLTFQRRRHLMRKRLSRAKLVPED